MDINILSIIKKSARFIVIKSLHLIVGAALGAIAFYLFLLLSREELKIWHTQVLDKEFSLVSQVHDFDDYLRLEDALFAQLQSQIVQKVPRHQQHKFNRYSATSRVNPANYAQNWDRSFILKPAKPQGSVLLIHGMSDSPYSLRTLAQAFYQKNYFVVALRLPGHGTAPSGLLETHWQDMAAAVELAAHYLHEHSAPDLPKYLLGYSAGATFAVNYALNAMNNPELTQVDALLLISPALQITAAASLAGVQARLSQLPGLSKLAWDSINPEYDPYKYTSFAINAAAQMRGVIKEVTAKLGQLSDAQRESWPRTLAVSSVADATVFSTAVVEQLLFNLNNEGNALLLFDINRHEDFQGFISADPLDDFRQLLKGQTSHFNLSLVTNASVDSRDVVTQVGWPKPIHSVIHSGLKWPETLFSLSHVALTFPDTDPSYGIKAEQPIGLPIGHMMMQGERGLLNISAKERLRLRYNPFYSLMQDEIFKFISSPTEAQTP